MYNVKIFTHNNFSMKEIEQTLIPKERESFYKTRKEIEGRFFDEGKDKELQY